MQIFLVRRASAGCPRLLYPGEAWSVKGAPSYRLVGLELGHQILSPIRAETFWAPARQHSCLVLFSERVMGLCR